MDSTFQIGERVQFTQPYLEGSEPQFPWVVITHVRWDGNLFMYKFRFDDESDESFIWFPECMFKKEVARRGDTG